MANVTQTTPRRNNGVAHDAPPTVFHGLDSLRRAGTKGRGRRWSLGSTAWRAASTAFSSASSARLRAVRPPDADTSTTTRRSPTRYGN